ncbi:toprim domain-containing protein [Streptomyces sp. DSM 41014]|uniref:Toprim domain-containing protein n=1 Tax=Streptomyces hintoniae TaxID=3075521 RepID=A0ABU2UHR4_9ACTN|nr:toprim domain-containing protein [Streptomyces sp. DSM 41014]MDT0472804.1 toprim domain-containing protein [Streptomyces sp. DSM 41014]
MTSLVPDPALKSFLEEATARYEGELARSPSAVEYLKKRGLSEDSAASYRLGFVENPLPGHETARGMLSVPYLTRSGVTTIRFRRLGDGDGPKYRSVPGDPPRIYNAHALLVPSDHIAICEGEFDAIAATEAGIPAIGIAGVSAWKSYFSRCFKGYRAVYILADQDDKGQGMEFAEKVAEQIKNARISPMPAGHDVNSFVLAYGRQALLDRLEIKA